MLLQKDARAKLGDILSVAVCYFLNSCETFSRQTLMAATSTQGDCSLINTTQDDLHHFMTLGNSTFINNGSYKLKAGHTGNMLANYMLQGTGMML